jgi:hypothetical protein
MTAHAVADDGDGTAGLALVRLRGFPKAGGILVFGPDRAFGGESEDVQFHGTKRE